MILFFYNLALLAALVAGAPWWLWRMATTHKYREGCWSGWAGFRHAACQSAGRRPPADLGPCRLRRRGAGRQPPGQGARCRAARTIRSLISTTTRTGQALARERFGPNRVFYCPLDLPWAVRAYLNALQPRLLILAETEFWPNLLNGCFRRNIPVAVVNARISDRSWPRYRMLRRLWRPSSRAISAACWPRARPTLNGSGHWLPAGPRFSRRQSEIRCARRRGSRCHAPIEGSGAAICA